MGEGWWISSEISEEQICRSLKVIVGVLFKILQRSGINRACVCMCVCVCVCVHMCVREKGLQSSCYGIMGLVVSLHGLNDPIAAAVV